MPGPRVGEWSLRRGGVDVSECLRVRSTKRRLEDAHGVGYRGGGVRWRTFPEHGLVKVARRLIGKRNQFRRGRRGCRFGHGGFRHSSRMNYMRTAG
jgi:hypothetical protein